MHIPDGFLAAPVWGGLAAASAASVAVAARRARVALDEARVPLMGVMGAFVFAAQMINFPVAAGASGHLVGAALLTVTLGAAPAVVVMTAILAIQALVFQDGGLLALGANVFNMALVGVLAADWAKRARGGVFLAGFVSVFVAACLCLGELALSGVRMPPPVLGLALGVFALTAVLEGAITVAVVRALAKMNPKWTAGDAQARPVLAALGLAALVLAVGGFLVASALPDGLERVAGLVGLEGREQVLVHAPLPDYEAVMVENPWVRKAGAGLVGLAITFVVCLVAGKWFARWRSA